ncbi:MAG: hypothetical protein AB1458_08410 [Bacteroidota bacterium]
MKTKLSVLSAFAGVLFLASCSSGPSEATKKSLAALDSSWTAMGTMAMAWGDSLNKALAWCETACKEGEGMQCCEHLTGTKDSLMAPCKNDLKVFQDMKAAWDAEMPMWDSLQAKLDGIKEKVAKNEGTDEEINKVIAEIQGAMDNGSKEMETWVANFNAAKTTCMNNATACKTAWESAKCSDKKCSSMKKEEKKS